MYNYKAMKNKNLSLLAYLSKNHPEASVTVLIKLCYLADLVSIKRFGKKISNYDYMRYYFGPFDKQIYNDLESLVKKNILKATSDYSQKGEVIIYHLIENENEITDLNEQDKIILDELLKSMKGYGAKALTDIAYNTKPMKALGATLGGNEHLGKKLDLTLV